MTRSKLSALAASTLAVLALALAAAPEADAGWRCHRARRRCVSLACQAARYAAPAAYPAPAAYSTPQAVQAAPGEPYAFVAWISEVRRQHGLTPVSFDAALASDAAVNSSRGFAHTFMGRARRQNVGVGSLPTVSVAWLQSPAHAAAILDPTVTRFGLANVGGVWTLSLN